MNKYILDSSALLALIQQEQGAEVVRPLLQFSVMSAVNVAEVLALGDRACIALGIKLQASIYTADKV